MTTLASTSTLVYCLSQFPQGSEWLDWLNEEESRYLVVVSEERSSASHERIRVVSPKDEESIKRLCWELVFLPFEYEDDRDPAFQMLQLYQRGIHLVASSYLDRGLDLLGNFSNNSSHLEQARPAPALFGAFPKIPAIICGAGPSLELEAPYLRTLKDRALIFGGGTALAALSKFGIQPHFGGIIDPFPPEERFAKLGPLEVPTFFQTRAHPEMLKKISGPLLWTGGSEMDLFDEERFDGGWNVSTYLVALACHLGCDPIILVGVDLAQEQEKAYAGDLKRTEKGDLLEVEGGLLSRPDWIMASDWLADFAIQHPEVRFVSASGGLELRGFEKRSLLDLSFEQEEDLLGLVHTAIHKAEGSAAVLSKAELFESFKRVSSLCSKLVQVLEGWFPTPPAKDGEYVQLTLEMEGETAYRRFLLPIWNIWKHVFARSMPEDLDAAFGLELNQWLFMKGICDDAREI